MRGIKRRMPYRRVFVWIMSFVLLAVLLQLLGGLVAGHYLKSRLIREVDSSSGGKYQLKLGDLGIRIFSRSVIASDVELVPSQLSDSLIFYRLIAKKISLNGVGLIKLFRNKTLDCNSLELINPSVSLYGEQKGEKETSGSSRRSPLNIKHIRIKQGKFEKHSAGQEKISTSCLFDLDVRNFTTGEKGTFSYGNVSLAARAFCFNTPDSLYTLTVEKLRLEGSDLTLDSLHLRPNYNKSEFTRAVGHQTDRVVMRMRKVSADQLDVKGLSRESLYAGKIEIEGMDMEIYRDFRTEDDKKPVKMPQDQLRELKWKVKADTFALNRSRIVYHEQRDAPEPGEIVFGDLNGSIINITNQPEELKKDNTARAKLFCLLMDKGKMKVDMHFLLDDTLNRHSVSGEVSSMDATLLNRLLENISSYRIRKGMLGKCTFAFDADKKMAKGSVQLLYNDFSLLFAGKSDEKQNLPEKSLSFLKNVVFIKGENPKGKREPVTARIYFKRKEINGVFNYWWKSLYSGISSTIFPVRSLFPDEAVDKMKG